MSPSPRPTPPPDPVPVLRQIIEEIKRRVAKSRAEKDGAPTP